MSRYIDADKVLANLPDDLPYKASVKRVLMQAPTADVAEECCNLLLKAKKLSEEVADWKAIAEQYQKQFEEAKPDTVKDIQMWFAIHFGTYTDKEKVKVSEVFKLLDQIAKEMLEG